MQRRLRASFLCATSIIIGWSGIAHAQTQPRRTPAPRTDPAPLPSAPTEPDAPPAPQQTPDETPGADADIIVTGFRASLQSAIDLKRDSIAIRDSIVAEDIGKFPDANVAESLQRIPGVELVRDGNSNEGSTVQLRGLPSQFTVTTFNGSTVYTTSGGGVGNASRTFNYDVFPSELFGRADVYKSPLAELTEGGIAGVVDLRTPRPFDGKGGRKIRYAISGVHNGTTNSNDPRGNVLFSQTWGHFGVLVSAAAARVTNGRAGFLSTGTYSGASAPTGALALPGGAAAANAAYRIPGTSFGSNYNYNFAAPGVNLNGATQDQVNNAFLPRFFVTQAGANKRERFGVSGSLQFKNDRLNVSLDGLYSSVYDDNETKDVRWPIRDSNANNALNGALVPINVRVDANNNLQGTLGNVQFNYANFFNRGQTRYKYGALNAAYELTNRLTLSAQASLSNSNAYRNDITLTGDASQLKHTITFDTTNALFPTITTDRNLLDPATYITRAGPGYGGSYRTEIDKLRAGRFIADWDYGLGDLRGHLKAGFQYNENRKTLEVRATNNLYNNLTIPGVGLYGATTTTLAQRNAYIIGFLQPFRPADFIPGAPTTLPQAFLAFNKDFAYGTLDAVNVNRAAPFNLGSTYTAVETIKAGFIQTDLKTRLFGKALRGNIGLRYVSTDVDIDNNVLISGAFVPNNRKTNYSRFLPSATLAYNITDNIIARAAYGKTLTRSAIQSLAASISLPAGGAGNLILNSGNPDLKPEFSTGLDGSVEWYFTKGGILTFAAYKKTITGRAAPSSIFVPFNTLGIPSSIFTVNIQTQLATDPTTPVELISFVNLNRYTLNGLEASYQQSFTFLPHPFDGLGITASGTRVKTSGLNRSVPAVPTTGQVYTYDLNDVPKYTFQVGAFYEKGPLTLRTTYNYKSEVATIAVNGVNAIGLQRYGNSRGYLDATASFKVATWLEFRVDATNITKTKTYDFFRSVGTQYGDEQSRLENGAQNGRTITFGIRGAF